MIDRLLCLGDTTTLTAVYSSFLSCRRAIYAGIDKHSVGILTSGHCPSAGTPKTTLCFGNCISFSLMMEDNSSCGAELNT